MQEIGVDLGRLRIVACHRQGKTYRTIVKFLNRKNAGTVFLNKKKLKVVDISHFSPDGIENIDRKEMIAGGKNEWRDGGQSPEKENF